MSRITVAHRPALRIDAKAIERITTPCTGEDLVLAILLGLLFAFGGTY